MLACLVQLHYGWSAITQLIVAVALLLRALGPSALVGMAIMLLFVPMQAKVMQGLRLARRAALQYTDQRIKLLNEVLQGIRVIKVYAWEGSFIKAIADLRHKEMFFVRKAGFIRGRNAVATQLGPILMALGSFIVLGATGGQLKASNVFSSVVLFNLLRMPLMQIPNVLNMLADAQIGLHRIQKFLLAEELTQLPARMTPQEASKESAQDRFNIQQGRADPALKEAYEALLAIATAPNNINSAAAAAATAAGTASSSSSSSSFSSSAAAAPIAVADAAAPVAAAAAAAVAAEEEEEVPFAIKIEHADFSWDVLPGDVVADDPAELAAAMGGGGGRGGRGGGRGGRGAGAARGGRGGKQPSKAGAESAPAANGRGAASARGGRSGRAVEAKPLLLATAATSPSNGDAQRGGGGDGDGDGEGSGGALQLASDAVDIPRVAPSVLHDINLVIPRGKLTLVCGSVGSGKSSLLSGLLGEMKRKAGRVKVAGRIAFCAQTAWIQNNSVRQNILFGQKFDPRRYAEVIRVCALTRDLKVLPDGDRTEIGEKGTLTHKH